MIEIMKKILIFSLILNTSSFVLYYYEFFTQNNGRSTKIYINLR